MSLRTQLESLAARVAAEFNQVRTEFPTGGGQTWRYFKVRNDTAMNINATTSWADITIAGSSVVSSGSDFTAAGGGIQCNFTGEVDMQLHLGMTGAGTRLSPNCRFAINGNPEPLEGATAYIRNSSGHNASSLHLNDLLSVTTGDTITVQTIREAGTTAATVAVDKAMLKAQRWA